MLAVSIHGDQIGGGCLANACLQRSAIPPIYLVMDHMYIWRMKFVKKGARVIAGTIIHENKFPIPGKAEVDQGRGKYRQVLPFVVNRYDNREMVNASLRVHSR